MASVTVYCVAASKTGKRPAEMVARPTVRYYQSRSCAKVQVAILDSPSLTVLTVSVDVKQH